MYFFFSSRRRHTRLQGDWSSDVCSSDLSVFKAAVAIAPVTDLEEAKQEWRNWSNYRLESEFIGEGPQVRAGSPARNADKIKAPVLLFHGALDRNVSISESRHMAKSLESAGVRHELVTWDDLDHELDDSNARAEMLRKSEAFLRAAFGGGAAPRGWRDRAGANAARGSEEHTSELQSPCNLVCRLLL